jgi:hypothetical protein
MKMTRLLKYLADEKQDRNPFRGSLLDNEGGSVIVIALVMLMLLTMAGTSATTTSTIEIQVAGNERSYKQFFFRAEGAALQASQRVKNDAISHLDAWIRNDSFLYVSGAATPNNFTTLSNWDDLGALYGTDYTNMYAMVVYKGIAAGGSVKVTSTQNQLFSVYGKYLNAANNDGITIETGYSKRM